MKKKNYKIDIFKVFGHINEGNTGYFNLLTEEDKKNLSPYVIQRWMYGAEDLSEMHIILTDEYMNEFTFNLQGHTLLLYKLACAANGGYGDTRYKFIKPSRKGSNELTDAICQWYHCSVKEASQIESLLTGVDKQEILESYGSYR